MALSGECLEFLSLAGAGKVVFRTGSAAEPLDARLSHLIETTNVPADVAVFVLTSDVASVGLRDHLRGVTEQGLDLVVNLVDPETMRLVGDLGILDAAQRSLGGVPLTDPIGQRVPRVVATAADAHRLLPAGQVANRDQLRTLPTRRDLGEWLRSAPDPVPEQPVTDLSPLLGVPHALFGALPVGDLAALRDHPAPLSLRLVEEALGGTLTHVGIDVVAAEFASGRASAALVHGWAPGSAAPRTFWLLPDPAVGLRWADPLASGEKTPPAVLDGAVDERAAIAEQPRSTSLLLDVDGRPYPPAADSTPLDVPAEVTMVGEWSAAGRTATRRQILDVAEAAGVPVVVVDVRRGPLVARMSTLDPVLSIELAQAMRAQPGRPLVVATERNAQLEWMVREQFEGATVVPEITGLGDMSGWLAQSGPGAAERYEQLTVDSLFRVAPASIANPLPTVLGKWLRSPTWAVADTYFQENAAALRAPEVVTALGDLADRIAGRAEALASDGTPIKQSPFFQPDRTLPAFRSVVDVAVRAANAPGRTSSYAPNTQLLIDEIPPHTAQTDENLLLGYLASRPLTHLDPAPPPYTTGLLWMRELMQGLVYKQVTGLRVDEILAVTAARGELAGERAARVPNAKEVFRSNATLTEALTDIIFSERGSELAARASYDVDFLKRIGAAIDCLPGPDRTAWNYIYEHSVLPRFTAERESLNLLLERIATC